MAQLYFFVGHGFQIPMTFGFFYSCVCAKHNLLQSGQVIPLNTRSYPLPLALQPSKYTHHCWSLFSSDESRAIAFGLSNPEEEDEEEVGRLQKCRLLYIVHNVWMDPIEIQ